jgi:hemerythrin-like domain-containing protein
MHGETSRRDPLVQLERCHRRLEEACQMLASAAVDHDIDAANEAFGFFGRQGKRHEGDEDVSVFPRLAARSDASAEVQRAITEIAAEHAHHAALHERLDAILAGREEGDMWSALADVAQALSTSYAAHIAKEETVLFPAVRTLLTDDDREAIATEMEARRTR